MGIFSYNFIVSMGWRYGLGEVFAEPALFDFIFSHFAFQTHKLLLGLFHGIRLLATYYCGENTHVHEETRMFTNRELHRGLDVTTSTVQVPW